MNEDELRGQLIARLREDRLWTREELAKRAKVTPTTVSQAETGRTHVRLRTIGKLAEALGVPAATLLRPSEEKEPALSGKAEAPGEAGPPSKPVGMPHARFTEVRNAPSEEEIAAAIEGVLKRAGVGTRWAALSDEEWTETLEKTSREEARNLYLEIENERNETYGVREALFRTGTQREKSAQARMLKRYWVRLANSARKAEDQQAIASADAVLEKELVGIA